MSPAIQNPCHTCFMLLSILPEASAVEFKYAPPKTGSSHLNRYQPLRKSSSKPGNKRLQPRTRTYALKIRAGRLNIISTLTIPAHSQVKHHAVKRHVGSGMASSHSLSVSESSQAKIFCSYPLVQFLEATAHMTYPNICAAIYLTPYGKCIHQKSTFGVRKFLRPNICAAIYLTPYGKYIHQKSHFWIGKALCVDS